MPSTQGFWSFTLFPSPRNRHETVKRLLVNARWDAAPEVWSADSDDIPGLATEAESVEALMQKLKVMVPELLEINGWPDEDEVAFELLLRRFETARRQAA
jgi:predicted RNase H-like HicB family nuclease